MYLPFTETILSHIPYFFAQCARKCVHFVELMIHLNARRRMLFYAVCRPEVCTVFCCTVLLMMLQLTVKLYTLTSSSSNVAALDDGVCVLLLRRSPTSSYVRTKHAHRNVGDRFINGHG